MAKRGIASQGVGRWAALAILLALAACRGQVDEGARPDGAATGAQATLALPEGVELASPEATTLTCEDLPQGTDYYAGPDDSPVLSGGTGRVPGQANIFGAGLEAPPAPGGGGGGVLPPVFALPSGTSRVVTFPTITGRVNPIVHGPTRDQQASWNGANGDRGENGATDVESLGGVSGIVNRTNGMFLGGVFLDDAPASSPAPPRLEFTFSNEREFDLAPQIGQVFFIGDGKGRGYLAPDEATRLFLGFADAYLYEGCPGWYGNNAGHLTVKIKVMEG